MTSFFDNSRRWTVATIVPLLGASLIGVAAFTAIGEPPGDDAAIIGQVVDGHGPVAGARVRRKGSGDVVTTDAHGIFRLPRGNDASSRITAATPGHFICGADASDTPVELRLERLPRGDHVDYRWVDPAADADNDLACANCHERIYRDWKTSGHSRAATNRRLMSLYEGTDWAGKTRRGWSLVDEYPHGAGVCVACHAPGTSIRSPAFDDLRQVDGVARAGVYCDYCHKIHRAPLDNVGLAHGVLGVKMLRPERGQIFFGPLDDDDRGHSVYSPLQRQSRMCAACHEGVVFGVPVYTTFSEWLAGPDRAAGHTCQSCHMASTGTIERIASDSAAPRRDPTTISHHGFPPQGRRKRLQDCLQLETHLQVVDDRIVVDVTLLAHNAGHRLPTGYIDRQLILHVAGRDVAGTMVAADDGPCLPAAVGASLARQPGKLYAKLLTDVDGNAPAPFWRPGVRLSDTRLWSGRAEQVRFSFPATTNTVRVRILYRRFWEQVAGEKQWPDDTIVVHDRTETP